MNASDIDKGLELYDRALFILMAGVALLALAL